MIRPAVLLASVVLALGLAAPAPSPATAVAPAAPVAPVRDDSPQVLAISVDALTPVALQRLGRSGAPHLWRLIDEGASTLNARSQVEQTVTLPNHTSMVTGRRIDPRRGGHGVTWNVDRPGTTVSRAAGHRVESAFTRVDGAGLSTALFASKTKFSLFSRSWPNAIDKAVVVEERDAHLAKAARNDLIARDRAFTFLHLGGADKAGHEAGGLSRHYLDAVRRVDGLVGLILDAADRRSELDDLVVVLTADHGVTKNVHHHDQAGRISNYRVPFAVWGPGIEPADLYDLNPDYADPGRTQPAIAARRQPVRNGDVANVVCGLLGLDPVRGSLFGAAHPLDVT